jgi:hypothetical protein
LDFQQLNDDNISTIQPPNNRIFSSSKKNLQFEEPTPAARRSNMTSGLQ